LVARRTRWSLSSSCSLTPFNKVCRVYWQTLADVADRRIP
jgi:hypothetical protein